MGMFIVEKGVVARAIKDGREWVDKNFQTIKTKEVNVFDKHELIIDPTGIGTAYALTRANKVTIGGAYAAAGWYGFRRDGWSLLVESRDVVYG